MSAEDTDTAHGPCTSITMSKCFARDLATYPRTQIPERRAADGQDQVALMRAVDE